MSAAEAGFDPTGWTHDYADTNGVRLHYVTQGEGPLVLLLHGFPEHWYSWRFQIGPLAEAGFRVVAPDLRGYNLSDKPRGGYDIKNLTKDVRGLIRALGEQSATIVGHDWGGVIALQFPIDYAAACDRLVVMNAPLIRSWYWGRRNYPNNTYALLMQVPGFGRTPQLGGCRRNHEADLLRCRGGQRRICRRRHRCVRRGAQAAEGAVLGDEVLPLDLLAGLVPDLAGSQRTDYLSDPVHLGQRGIQRFDCRSWRRQPNWLTTCGQR